MPILDLSASVERRDTDDRNAGTDLRTNGVIMQNMESPTDDHDQVARVGEAMAITQEMPNADPDVPEARSFNFNPNPKHENVTLSKSDN